MEEKREKASRRSTFLWAPGYSALRRTLSPLGAMVWTRESREGGRHAPVPNVRRRRQHQRDARNILALQKTDMHQDGRCWRSPLAVAFSSGGRCGDGAEPEEIHTTTAPRNAKRLSSVRE